MILQTMTPDEKVRQMECLFDPLNFAATDWVRRNARAVFRTKTFPSFFTSEVDLSGMGMGRWTLVVTAGSKSDLKKRVLSFRAYQTYHVARAKNPTNIGTGIWMFDASDDGVVRMKDFPPHYFCRLRERFIEPKGIVQPDFPSLVRMMLGLHHSSMDETIMGLKFEKDDTGHYALVKDTSADRQEGFCNLVTYHRQGISLGVSACQRRYFLWTTYVPNSLLYQDQIEGQKKRLAELKKLELQQRYDPFATYDLREFGTYRINHNNNDNERITTKH